MRGESGILKICKDYLKSYVTPWYVVPGLAAGAYGAACAMAGYAIPALAKKTLEGVQYVVQYFPHIDIYKSFDYTAQTLTQISKASMKEGLKGFFQFFIGSVFVMKFMRNTIARILRGGEK